MPDLTTLARLREHIPDFPDDDAPYLGHLITSCSAVVETYCARTFALTTYDELYHGGGKPYLLLNQSPITRVIGVRYGVMPALFVFCNDNTTFNATVEVNATGVTCTRFVGTTVDAHPLLYTTYPTCGALVTAINALGNGWKATLGGNDPFLNWPTADLAAFSETHGVRYLTCRLNVHRWWLNDYRLNPDVGEIRTVGIFQVGYDNYRINYTAGYGATAALMPADVQDATCEVVRNAYESRRINTNLASESLGSYSYSAAAKVGFDMLSASARRTLNQYRRLTVARYK
jgi:hypothetical protein